MFFLVSHLSKTFNTLTLCIVLIIFSMGVRANEQGGELAELMALLEEETALATKTNMNADFVPGMVTILHGDKLKKLGMQTAGESLGLIPGIYSTVGNTGQQVSIVRGVGSALSSSNLKILLNGVPSNSASSGTADSILSLPVFQIDRIEVIRGPGSPIYGEFAFSGVVNIITRTNTNAVHAKVGRYNTRQVDGIVSGGSNDKKLSWTFNFSSWDTDGSERMSGPDNFSDQGKGYAPDAIFDNKKGNTLILQTDYSGYKLAAQYNDKERGEHYGKVAKSPENNSSYNESIFNIDLSKQWSITDTLAWTLSQNFQQTKKETNIALGVPAGAGAPGNVAPFDFFRQEAVDDSYMKTAAYFDWRAGASHKVLLGLEYSKYKIDDVYGHKFIDGVPIDLTEGELVVLNGSERQLSSIVLQDQWQALNDIEITYGARYDDYDDTGNSISPRIAAVWRLAEKHIIKAQYAEAFRPPTLEESYPGPDRFPGVTITSNLTPEELSTTEISYIYREPSRTFKVTLFQTDVSDLIELDFKPGAPPEYSNNGALDNKGVEFEWQQNISQWELLSNVSYVKTEDSRDIDDDFTGSVQWLANLAATWNITRSISSSVLVKYVGEQEGAELPNLRTPHAETHDAYTTADFSVTYSSAFGINGLLTQATIKNITDEEYTTQASPTQWPEGLLQGVRYWAVDVEYVF